MFVAVVVVVDDDGLDGDFDVDCGGSEQTGVQAAGGWSGSLGGAMSGLLIEW